MYIYMRKGYRMSSDSTAMRVSCVHIYVWGIECHLILRFSYLTIFSTVCTLSNNLSHIFYIGPSHEIQEWTLLIFMIFGYFCNDNRTKFSKQKS